MGIVLAALPVPGQAVVERLHNFQELLMRIRRSKSVFNLLNVLNAGAIGISHS